MFATIGSTIDSTMNAMDGSEFGAMGGAKLNALLFKVVARYSLLLEKEEGLRSVLDAEAVEHAVFSLYLMSNYGFSVSLF